jgi:signal transduction histidine kinase
MAILAVILFVLGALAGGFGVWLVLGRRLHAARAGDAQWAEGIIKLSHDIRGAVTPALLMAERLEMNADPAVQQAASIIAQAMDRTSEIAKAASAEARARAGVAKEPARSR